MRALSLDRLRSSVIVVCVIIVHSSRRSDRGFQQFSGGRLQILDDRRIPKQLLLTSSKASLHEEPLAVQKNINRTLALDPELTVRWFDDKACLEYLRANYDSDLVRIFQLEQYGAYRGDICRTAVLAKEGGFYTDLDVQMAVPLGKMVDASSSFVSVIENSGSGDPMGILNAIIIAKPREPVLIEALHQMKSWYTHDMLKAIMGLKHGHMGVVATAQALEAVIKQSCPERKVHWHNRALQDAKFTCGPSTIQLYWQDELACKTPSKECPPARASSQFLGEKFGIFSISSPEKEIVAWPRFEECKGWGCEGEAPSQKSEASSQRTVGCILILGLIVCCAFPVFIKSERRPF